VVIAGTGRLASARQIAARRSAPSASSVRSVRTAIVAWAGASGVVRAGMYTAVPYGWSAP
jgi:hypothetical protein